MKKRYYSGIMVIALVLSLYFLTACGKNEESKTAPTHDKAESETVTKADSKTAEKPKEEPNEKPKTEYQYITPKEAKEKMEKEEVVIVDVRTQAEFAAGHIPDAILVPNETIGKEMPVELPDKEATLLLYCRSGNRSKQAARKLIALGYQNVYDFGGIIDWEGEIVK